MSLVVWRNWRSQERIELHESVGASLKLEINDLVLLIGEGSLVCKWIVKRRSSKDQLIPLQSIEEAAISLVDDFEGVLLLKGSRANQLENLLPAWAVDHLPEEESS